MSLEFNSNMAKSLSFTASIEGVPRAGLKVRFILEHNNIEYGFAGKVEEGSFKFEIPKLNEVIKNITNTRQQIPARVEVTSDGSIFSPWNESISLVVPQVVQATLENKDESVVSPKINIAIKEVEHKEVKKEKKRNDKSEVFSGKINDFLNKIGG